MDGERAAEEEKWSELRADGSKVRRAARACADDGGG